MSAVTVRLTKEQAEAIWRCAGCAADTYDDAIAVLGSPSRVHALNRGMDKLAEAIGSSRKSGARV